MSNTLLTNVQVGASADTWGSACNDSWLSVIGGKSDSPRPTQRHQGDLMWVSDMLMEDREIAMRAGEETGTKLLWIDEVAEQSDLESDPNAKHYGSLWTYDRNLGAFWKRYWELKEAQ